MKRCLLFCLLSLNSLFVFAGELAWNEGSVVLKTKEVLVGDILIEPQCDLILHRVNGIVNVYPAHKIHSLYFYDEETNINRKFISKKEEGLFNHHQLFEIVLSGEINIYRKQKAGTGNSPSDADGFYYYTYHNEQLIDLLKFRNQVYHQLIETSGARVAVFVFMEENRLNPNSSADAIKIIKFYNSLEKDNQLLAKH